MTRGNWFVPPHDSCRSGWSCKSWTRWDPECPLRWTSKSLEKLAAELRGQGHAVSPNTVAILLHDQGYSLQSRRKCA